MTTKAQKQQAIKLAGRMATWAGMESANRMCYAEMHAGAEIDHCAHVAPFWLQRAAICRNMRMELETTLQKVLK